MTADSSECASQYASVNGLRLHYLRWGGTGEPGKPTIVMLHGLRSFARTFEPIADALAANYQVIALDQRGRGDSEWDSQADYFTETYVSDLAMFTEMLGLDNFILLGHSMGGANAIVFAAQFPTRLRGVIIEDIGPGSSKSSAGAARIINELNAAPVSFESWAAARAYWRANRPLISDDALTMRVDETLMLGADDRITWRFDLEGIRTARLAVVAGRHIDLWPYVDKIRCPGLVLRGGESDFLPLTTATEMVDRNPRLRVATIPGASHYVHDDNFAGFLAEVNDFLGAL
jgi:esterase